VLQFIHSYYSLKFGVHSIEEIIERAVNAGIQTLALIDINNTSGLWDFVRLSKEAGIRPLAGVECKIENKSLFSLIAKNNEGLREIHEYLSWHNLNNKPLGTLNPEFKNVFIIYPFSTPTDKALADNEFIGVLPYEINKLFSSAHKKRSDKLIAFHKVTFFSKSDYELHKILVAIDYNTLLSKVEAKDTAHPYEIILKPEQLRKYYEMYPLLVSNLEKISESCSIEMNYEERKNRKTFCGSKTGDKELLKKLAFDGCLNRYGKNNKEAVKRVAHELSIIDQLSFEAYFLITYDIIRYAVWKDFFHLGRGSGANSVVAYCLGITDVDPIELNLYFERFLNPKRTSPPDFDLDFSWKDRDEITDYIFKRYGNEYTALLGTITTFQKDATIRELGKVYGLPKSEIDLISGNHLWPKHSIQKLILDTIPTLKNFPNIRSIHAGGIMISELPISYYSAVDLPPKGFSTLQHDMYLAESISFDKLDVLSQRGLGHIKEAVDIVKQTQGLTIDIRKTEDFKKNDQVRNLISSSKTIGCFYIESPAMRQLLKKLKCSDYLTLVAASSIIRPGVAQSGMMKSYIERFHNPDGFEYLHPVMKEQLGETYGVMVYQEDVLKICHHFAGLDLSDADILRRGMSGKFRSKDEFNRIKDRFFSNCKEKGYTAALTLEVWRQVESFAGYSFSKAHSASYAVESYQSLYLKTYFPHAFHTAVINNFGGFYKTWVYVHEARKCGATIHLPCVNNSEDKTCLKNTNDIYLGFQHVENLESKFIKYFLSERDLNGEFNNFRDFISRVNPDKEQLNLLIRIGAFRFTGISKKNLLWDACLKPKTLTTSHAIGSLFPVYRKTFVLPELAHSDWDDIMDQIELLGFPVTHSYFDMVKTDYRGDVMTDDLINHLGKTVRMMGIFVTVKPLRTKTGKPMGFGCFIDVNGDFFDTIHFTESYVQYPFQGAGVYLVEGKVVEDFGLASLEVKKMRKVDFKA